MPVWMLIVLGAALLLVAIGACRLVSHIRFKRLQWRRAKAWRQHYISQGISPEKIVHERLGETHLITTRIIE